MNLKINDKQNQTHANFFQHEQNNTQHENYDSQKINNINNHKHKNLLNFNQGEVTQTDLNQQIIEAEQSENMEINTQQPNKVTDYSRTERRY